MISWRKIKESIEYSCHCVPKIDLEPCHIMSKGIPINYNNVSPAHKLLLTTLSKRSATMQDPNHAAQSHEPVPEAVNPLLHSTQPNTKLQMLQGEKQRH